MRHFVLANSKVKKDGKTKANAQQLLTFNQNGSSRIMRKPLSAIFFRSRITDLLVCRPGYIILQEVVRRQSEGWRVCGLRCSLCNDECNQSVYERKNELRYNRQLVSLGVQQPLNKHGVPPLTKQTETRRVRVTVVVAKRAIASGR